MDGFAFEEKVRKNLERLGLVFCENLRIGAAVSGGADSLSLLLSLAEILKNEEKVSGRKLSLYVINVNHNIRSQDESSADSDFVASTCKKLQSEGLDVIFECHELARGRVMELSEEREGGIEEAARFLRYQAFEEFICRHNLDFLCLAHNQNDQFETLLMRFLQGSGLENCGIAEKRDFASAFILRPLLNIERSEIEAYLRGRKMEWRTDSTNADSSYLRNNIRLNLVPLLDQKFAGWKKALLAGREKNFYDREIIRNAVDKVKILEDGNCLSVPAEEFFALPDGIKIRLLAKMCSMTGGQRIPFAFLQDVCREKSFFDCKRYKNIEISYKKALISVKKHGKIQTDFAFSVIIEKEGDYDFHFGKMSFFYKENEACKTGSEKKAEVFLNGKDCGCSFHLPLLVRSLIYGDHIASADGALKKVNDVFSDWKVPEHQRGQIPLLQEITSDSQQLLCIFGEVLGFDNWIVK